MSNRRKYPKSVFHNIQQLPYNTNSRFNLYKSVKESEDWIQRLKLLHKLPLHRGCVNCICWNETGDKILSGSDDQNLIVTNPFNYKVLTQFRTKHRANIFSAKFLPRSCDTRVVSCSGDGAIIHTNLLRLDENQDNIFTCHVGTAYEIATIPYDPNIFMSCGEDFTVRSFDLRIKNKCNKTKCIEDVIIHSHSPVTALTVNAVFPHQVAVGCADSTVRLFDRRMIEGPNCRLKPIDVYVGPGLEKKSCRITSLNYSPEGLNLLVSYSSEQLYLFDLKDNRNFRYSVESTRHNCYDDDDDEEELGLWCAEKNNEIPPVRRLRLRGDWSDTGPDARPHGGADSGSGTRPTVQGGLMQRMTDVLSRMLNDPGTRAALRQGDDDTLSESEVPVSERNNLGESTSEECLEENNDMAQIGEVDTVEDDAPEESALTEDPVHEEPYEPFDQFPGEPEGEQSLPSTSKISPVLQNSLQETVHSAEELPTNHLEDVSNPQPSTSRQTSSLTDLSDELSTMLNGFKERFYKKPVVHLKKGSSSIASMSLENHHPDVQASPSSDPEDNIGDNKKCSISSSESCSSVSGGDTEHSRTQQNSKSDPFYNFHVKIKKANIKMKYSGHRNARTMIKEANFWGSDYVMSGSDCGHVFIWQRDTGRLVMTLEADHHVVNCLQPHPFLPLLATSGIDYDVKLWAPLAEEPYFDVTAAEELMSRNAIMLEETKDTVTVPASFMIRMLACLNQLRRGGRGNSRSRESSSSNCN